MADSVFPTALWDAQDSKNWSVTQEDNAIKGETDGGYVYARRRNTRRPRLTFTTGWTDISQSLYLEAIAFYNEVGTWKVFTFKDPTTGVTYRVRFGQPPKWQYAGVGVAKLWTTSGVSLIEA